MYFYWKVLKTNWNKEPWIILKSKLKFYLSKILLNWYEIEFKDNFTVFIQYIYIYTCVCLCVCMYYFFLEEGNKGLRIMERWTIKLSIYLLYRLNYTGGGFVNVKRLNGKGTWKKRRWVRVKSFILEVRRWLSKLPEMESDMIRSTELIALLENGDGDW